MVLIWWCSICGTWHRNHKCWDDCLRDTVCSQPLQTRWYVRLLQLLASSYWLCSFLIMSHVLNMWTTLQDNALQAVWETTGHKRLIRFRIPFLPQNWKKRHDGPSKFRFLKFFCLLVEMFLLSSSRMSISRTTLLSLPLPLSVHRLTVLAYNVSVRYLYTYQNAWRRYFLWAPVYAVFVVGVIKSLWEIYFCCNLLWSSFVVPSGHLLIFLTSFIWRLHFSIVFRFG